MKLRLSILMLLAVFVLAVPVFASGFQLTSIGSLSVEGTQLSHYWYSSEGVTFSGVTSAGTEVTADIDGVTGNAGVGAEGNWSYSTTLAEGDHNVSFASNGSTISFVLTIGSMPESTGSGSGIPTTTTPTVGTMGPTLLLLVGGGVAVMAGLFFRRRMI